MPRLAQRLPRLCRHKATGLAVVYLDGKATYLGKHGTPEVRARYQDAIRGWLDGRTGTSGEAPAEPVVPTPAAPTVAELLMRFKRHAERYYGGREVDNLGDALRPVRALYGGLEAARFGPAQLRRVRDQMVAEGLARTTVNARVNRVRRFFRWCVEHEHLHPDVVARLDAVAPLKRGRGGREVETVKPVAWADVQATLPHLPPMVRAMVLLAWYTGARPGEVTRLTTGMIDRSGTVWTAALREDKNAHRGQGRELLIGPRAQEALAPWLLPERPDEPVFSPRRVDDRQPKRRGRRLAGLVYSRAAFRQVIVRGCRRAGVEPWSPNALRHAAATRLREAHGLEAAQVALGHRRPDTTLIYTHAARARAVKAIGRLG